MKVETTITEISGSFYVRIPANMVDYFRLKDKPTTFIQDVTESKAIIRFQKR